MAYCTNAQVADEFNGIPGGAFSSTTNPTDTTVDRWIAEADALIDSKVGLRYDVPITDVDDLIVIRQIAIMLVSARIRRRLNRVGPDGETAKIKVTDTFDQAMKLLDSIIKGLTDLPNSDLRNSDVGVSSFSTSLESPHKFTRDSDDW